jgi:hypothetical protein
MYFFGAMLEQSPSTWPVLLRHPIKEMAEGVRDGRISLFFDVRQTASVCEQNVSVWGSPESVHQSVNKVHQTATMASPKTAPGQPKMRSGT